LALKGWIGLIGLAVAFVAAAAAPPEQPFPFSHRSHAGVLKQQCVLCHANPDPGKIEGVPTAASCMQCHADSKNTSPVFRKLASYAKANRPIPWVRIYSVPDFVIFNHRAHVNAGAACEDCHGKVTETELVSLVPDFTQTHCLNCHRAAKVSTECSFCHNLK
jgi:hypothetical protein